MVVKKFTLDIPVRLALLLIFTLSPVASLLTSPAFAAATSQALVAQPADAINRASDPQTNTPLATTAPLTTTIFLNVVAARTVTMTYTTPPTVIHKGDPVSNYKFIINQDNTGDPFQPRYPDCSPWMDATHTTPNPDYPSKSLSE